MDLFTQASVLGLSNAAVYMLLAVGVSLIFGLVGVMNFAHGEFMTLGAYAAVLIGTTIGLGFWLPLLVGAVASAALGAVSYRVVIGPMRARPQLMTLVATFGLALLCQGAVYAVWGGEERSVTRNTDALDVLGVRVPATSAANIVIAAVTMAALLLIVSRTAFGRELRAVAQNRREAQLAGVDPLKVELLAVVLSAAVAGIAGVMLAQRMGVTPFVGFNLVLKAFAIAIVAGLGRLHGVVVVAVALGLAEAYVTTYVDGSLSTAVVFGALLLTLMVRPQGVFGLRTRG